MRKRIGHAREKDGLYYLEESNGQNKKGLSLSLFSKSSLSNKDKIRLYHYYLGHPLFSVLEIMFPLLFKETSVDCFHYTICELAKHRHISF